MKYSHEFVEKYDDLIGFGLDRKTDEKTIICYLQMFSDDELMKVLIGKMSDEELSDIFSLITKTLQKHLTEPEYHEYFLKEKEHSH
jgi:hypothetical protein